MSGLPQYLYQTPFQGFAPGTYWTRRKRPGATRNQPTDSYSYLFYDHPDHKNLILLTEDIGEGSRSNWVVAPVNLNDALWGIPKRDVEAFEALNNLRPDGCKCPPGTTPELILSQIPKEDGNIRTMSALETALELWQIYEKLRLLPENENSTLKELGKMVSEAHSTSNYKTNTVVQKIRTVNKALERLNSNKPPLRG